MTQNSQSNELPEDFRIRRKTSPKHEKEQDVKKIHKVKKHKDRFRGNFGNKRYSPEEFEEDEEC